MPKEGSLGKAPQGRERKGEIDPRDRGLLRNRYKPLGISRKNLASMKSSVDSPPDEIPEIPTRPSTPDRPTLYQGNGLLCRQNACANLDEMTPTTS
ncbi:hypothetical protein C8R42DRAFT_717285 [Lentinula raphanica]|nr:hypothetical protein C8R42DRAFT_717285 [Lentinula raphanica]